ncbi:UNKNOWN [Stylonychia lemnae]|uniref:Uncharacterized protein n=1 Tax=Stylonychia lemnae TaxID=5949 RepID=A0A078A317_STYLE|nr:UNKNOWN [Stylonychia lemnae]|eukprot:CDW75164.1 UNKNOWN [Stylonychia lemnae]
MGANSCKCLQNNSNDTVNFSKRTNSKVKKEKGISFIILQLISVDILSQTSDYQNSPNENSTKGQLQKADTQNGSKNMKNGKFNTTDDKSTHLSNQQDASIVPQLDTQQKDIEEEDEEQEDDSVEIERIEKESRMDSQSMMSDTEFRRMDNDGGSSFASQILRVESDVSGINREINHQTQMRRATHQSQMTDTSFVRAVEDDTMNEGDEEQESDQFGDALFKKHLNTQQRDRLNTHTNQTNQRLVQKSEQLKHNRPSDDSSQDGLRFVQSSVQQDNHNSGDFNHHRDMEAGSISSDNIMQKRLVKVNTKQIDQYSEYSEGAGGRGASGDVNNRQSMADSEDSDNIFKKKQAQNNQNNNVNRIPTIGQNKKQPRLTGESMMSEDNFEQMQQNGSYTFDAKDNQNNFINDDDDDQISENSDAIGKRKAKVVYND